MIRGTPGVFTAFDNAGSDPLSLVYAMQNSTPLYYLTVNVYGVCQGIAWTGLWVIAHDCGHSGFSRWGVVNDTVGFVLHSFLLAPYFSWKLSDRRHHIYANHIEKDLNYVPPLRQSYADKIGQAVEVLEDIGQDAPFVLFLRILLQQTIGWNWYILTNITCPPTAIPRKCLSRHSHFDPQGALFYPSEWLSIVLSDLGCFTVIAGFYQLYQQFGSFETLFWVYIVPWTWVHHWVVMITYLHHTHPSVPKYCPESWSFLRGATATMDRDFGIIGTHFFHHISTDHVTHHLFSRIPHYYSPVASKAIIPLLGSTTTDGLVEEDPGKDVAFGLRAVETLNNKDAKNIGLWYRGGRSPLPEFKMREAKSF
ncbi:hypothetical protein BO83DRAFT_419146 [Aspergillus eucalypticola CBS 122712]|uniref:Fatty acid desaturase domain-containing protein n=1 Tax=Aspergillus eucalypticola (strain CBS 122712 / IBT 29274) TaxID=1448314 RepID=A0A317V1I5_ASPEC|nr:uncharacterized protein BO83DRAFT_419146 [Aspergillus eucalypticola CBS 122712]PWY67846.1 hypothetical protein BO83DRAFT_419146 [Aspergillus eucalypticola CBS 122712]